MIWARATRAYLPLALYLGLLDVVDVADWGQGWIRTSGLMVIAWLLWVETRHPPGASRGLALWLIAPAAAGLLRYASETASLRQPDLGRGMNDIGGTTVRAIYALRRGESLYASNIDVQHDLPRSGHGFDFFFGYKYGPLMPRYYAPFVEHFGGEAGMYIGNAILLLLVGALVTLIARRLAGCTAAMAAVFCLLFPGFTYFEIYNQGVTDLLPTLFLLTSIWAALGARAFAAGLAIGLSFSIKPLPAALFAPLLVGTLPLLPLSLGTVVGATPLLPDLLSTPRELIANWVLFNLERPGDSTSLAYFAPAGFQEAAQTLVTTLVIAAIVTVVAQYHRDGRRPCSLLTSGALATTLFLAGGKIVHRNYFLWWTPLLAIAVGVLGYSADTEERRGVARSPDGRA